MTTAPTAQINVWLELDHDPDVENPADADQTWVVHSFSTKHSSYLHPSKLGLGLQLETTGFPACPKAMEKRLAAGTAFWLSWYGHGDEIWWRANGPAKGQACRFDSRRVAGIALWNHGTKRFRENKLFTYDQRAEDLDGFLETYTAWSNGSGWMWRVTNEDNETIESCGGYYSDSEALIGMVAALRPNWNANTGALAPWQRDKLADLRRS